MESTSDSASQSSTDFIQSSGIVSDYDRLIRAALNSRPVVLLNNLKPEQVAPHSEHNTCTEQTALMCIKQEPDDIIPHLQGYDGQQDTIQTDMSLIDLKPSDVEISISPECYSGELLPHTSLNKANLVQKQGYTVDVMETLDSNRCEYLTTPDNNLSVQMSNKCDQCDFRTSHMSHLTLHIRIHTGEKPYKCEQCDFQTAQKSNLKRHIRTHTGEKPYKCDHCDYWASRKSRLEHHIRTHTGEKPYKCDQCDFQTAQNSRLKQHMAIHTGEKPYKCEQCDFQTAHKSNLNEHMRTHTGEKPHTCDQCGYQFVRKSTLNRHMATHTGDKPYKCGQCDEQFKHNYQLKQHMSKHISEKPLTLQHSSQI